MKFEEIYKHRRRTIDDPRKLNKQVTRLIKNKIEPLSFKHYVLKSPNFINNYRALCLRLSLPPISSFNKSREKENIKQIFSQKNKQEEQREEVQHISKEINNLKYQELQEKVQNHIFVKKMLLMEDEYASAQQCNKKEKAKICKRIWTSPLEKYIGMFDLIEKPSEKVRLVDQASCEKILKQIKSVKTMKHIQCGEDPGRGKHNQPQMINDNRQKKVITQIDQSSKVIYRSNDKKLKKEIMKDIKKQYQTQGSTKIRIHINHQKMIQMI